MKHYLIYKITNNLNGKIYIGKHKTENIDDGYMGSGNLIQRAIKKYGIENFTKEILFDVYGEDLMNFLEEAIVDEAFVSRKDTYNIAVGGKGGFSPVCSEETRKKISEAMKGKKHRLGTHQSDEWKRNMSERMKGNKWNIGKHLSEEQRRKISEANKGKGHPHSEETKLKISNANKGYHHSEEAKRKISDASKGNKYRLGQHHSEEARSKMAESRRQYFANGGTGPNKGKHFSEETRKKMSESQKQRWKGITENE